MDNTMYLFDGEVRAKSNLALAVITKYAEAKKPTFDQLVETWGTMAVANETRAKSLADTSGRKRHFINAPIKLKDKIAFVSNQWRLDTIEKLIEKAKGMGMKISVAKEKQVPISEQKKAKPAPKKSAKRAPKPKSEAKPEQAPAQPAPKKRGRPAKKK